MDTLMRLLVPNKIELFSESETLPISNGKHKKIKLQPDESINVQLLCSNIAISAFENYLNRKLMQFDALVGENACQIRASMLQEMLVNQTIDENRLSRIVDKLHGISEALAKGQSLVEHEALDQFSVQEGNLILCHLLTCTRDPENRLETCEKMLNQFIPDHAVEPRVLMEMTYHAKKSLSERSIYYVQKSATEMESTNPIYKKMLRQIEDANSGGIKCTALFYNLSLLLEKLKQNRRLLMLNINDQCKLLYRADDKGILRKIEDPSGIEQEAAMVIYFKINEPEYALPFIKTIESNENDDVTDLILGDAADHPLFAGKVQSKNMQIFEHNDIKPLIRICQGDSIAQINAELKALIAKTSYSQKEIRTAETACKPSSLADIIHSHHRLMELKRCGKMTKQILQIVHVYTNIVGCEINRSGDVTIEEPQK